MVKALTTGQESRLINHLDEAFLTLNRHFETRHLSRAVLPDLASFIAALKGLHSLILSIPPIGASAPLRVAFYLSLISQLPSALSSYSLTPLDELWPSLSYFDAGLLLLLTGAEYDSATNDRKRNSALHSNSTGVYGTDRVRLVGILEDVRETLRVALGVQTKERVNVGGEVREPTLPARRTQLEASEVEMAGMTEEEGTPSLVSADEESSITEMDEENDEGDQEGDDDFEEVDVASPSGDNEEMFSIHFTAPPPSAVDLEPIIPEPPRLGFDPDTEYGGDDDDAEVLGMSEEDVGIKEEVEKVFASALSLLRGQEGGS